MSNLLNWKWGETCPVSVEIASATEVQVGDLLWLDTNGQAQPASAFAKDTDLAGTQGAFSQKFLGVAMQASPAATVSRIRVATTGTFEFSDDTSDASAEKLGTYMGANLNTAATYLKRDSLISVATAKLAVGRIIHQENIPAGKAYIAIRSTIMHGGIPGSDPTHTA